MSEQYPQDLLDLGYSQEIIDEYDNDLLRTLDGLMPWEVPGAEYQGYGNPFASWWGGGSIPMDDPRRAEAARALYERTGTLYTPFGDANSTLEKQIQATVDRINKQGQFRFGDAWETYYFDPLKFLDISLKGDRGQADYSQFRSALTQDIQDYYQQYDPESLNWRDEAISDIKIDMYQNRGETYEDYLADIERRANRPPMSQQAQQRYRLENQLRQTEQGRAFLEQYRQYAQQRKEQEREQQMAQLQAQREQGMLLQQQRQAEQQAAREAQIRERVAAQRNRPETRQSMFGGFNMGQNIFNRPERPGSSMRNGIRLDPATGRPVGMFTGRNQ